MKALNSVEQLMNRWPLLGRTLVLMVALVAYAAGLLAVDVATGDARMPVVLLAVFFLPAVLRAWLLVYWQVRDDLRGRFSNRHHSGV
ncbi:hypothetical protein K8B33_09685 [Alcanivorax sp. JB21]|uniref:hypothetical protein n=1 Tax=Alcanivorax limicola TaxID=2874102 RepID=UPI001CC009CC|nr:hypothetical protein [Alcanivorax limicola]MBZ2189368.1 hypothetical protein [Alcanivorax limicola]